MTKFLKKYKEDVLHGETSNYGIYNVKGKATSKLLRTDTYNNGELVKQINH